MTKTQIIEEVKKLPPEDKEEVMTALYKEGVSPSFDIPDEVLKDAIREARKTPAREITDRDWEALRTGDKGYLKKQWSV